MLPYRFAGYLLLAVLLAGCGGNSGQKMNKRITLWRKDKIPYGTYYAYESLRQIFPDADISVNRQSPDPYKRTKTFYGKTDTDKDQSKAYVIISPQVRPDATELDAIFNMVYEGQHVFISTFSLGQNLLDSLGLKTAADRLLYRFRDSLTVSVANPETDEETAFTYPGIALDNHFTKMDSSITNILGHDNEDQANFIRIDYKSGGSLYLHLAPAAFTNFFLLHKNNKAYYDQVLSYLPKNISILKWDDYFRYSRGGGSGSGGNGKSNFSALQWIAQQPGLMAAWWLVLLLLLILFLVESKRRQRILPRIEPLRNTSLDFVKTIGRLYFQRKDNQNLAQKMGAHFQDHVRSKYHLRTSVMDDEFERKLADKSGCNPEALRSMLYQLRLAQHDPFITDQSLLELDRQLRQFYQHAETI